VSDSYALERLEAAEEANADARAEASNRATPTGGKGRWHADRWQDDEGYDPDDDWAWRQR
jgi:hypothetical protein